MKAAGKVGRSAGSQKSFDGSYSGIQEAQFDPERLMMGYCFQLCKSIKTCWLSNRF
jgi:hypothetical protein